MLRPDISKPIECPHPYTFPLDLFQQHAISAISKDENVLVCAKTGSGKTLVGEYQIYHSMKKGKRVFYTTPIKSLSNQKFYDLKQQFTDIGIMTGDIKFCPNAQIVIMTTEILRNLLYKRGTTTEHLGLTASLSLDNLDAVIFDECHYINDKDRGKIWEETMILLDPSINLVLLSATLDHPEYFANWLGLLKEKPIHLIETQYRIVPLTHNLLDANYKLIPLMNAKEVYHEKTYTDWLKNKKNINDEKKAFQQKVKDSRQMGVEGAISGKIHTYGFLHQMNETIKMLEQEELLPAIFFILSRKQCELYADKVDTTLLSSSDIASVKHIISFHLHRKALEQVPQYHTIYNLLCRGVAFHHSGLLPVLKEIIEILFSKGFVKVLFCTETFAVGLNMPTKTVLFTGFKKFDDDGMRILRNDEYIQMAGRAGRRGKDDKGVIIYLPDHEPLEPYEMKMMMKGSKPPIISRMDFHYDFILKTIQVSKPGEIKWLHIMEHSYWFKQRQKQILDLTTDLETCQAKICEMKVDPLFTECEKRYELEQTKVKNKEYQRQLDSIKNKQLGPKWNTAWANYNTLVKYRKEQEGLENDIKILNAHEESMKPSIEFLFQLGYIKNNNPLTLKVEDLTLKGILATEVNEGHPILMTELYTQEILHNLSGIEIVIILSCFQEDKDDNPAIRELYVSDDVKNAFRKIKEIAKEFQYIESTIVYPVKDKYWNISTEMIEPMQKWMEGENASVICKEYGLFEGNFIRSVMKMANIVEEWISIATYCQHVEQIDKMLDIKQKIIRETPDSLYLHL